MRGQDFDEGKNCYLMRFCNMRIFVDDGDGRYGWIDSSELPTMLMEMLFTAIARR